MCVYVYEPIQTLLQSTKIAKTFLTKTFEALGVILDKKRIAKYIFSRPWKRFRAQKPSQMRSKINKNR